MCEAQTVRPAGVSDMRAWFLAIVLGVWMLGCGGIAVRQPAKDATLGALDALNAPRNNELARKMSLLLNQYLDKALTAGPPPGVEEISAKATRGAVIGLASTMPEQQWMVQQLVAQALRTSVDAMTDERGRIGSVAGQAGEQAALGLLRGMGQLTAPQGEGENEQSPLGQMSDEAARVMAQSMAKEMSKWFGADAKGPMADAMAAAAGRASGAAVQGALTAARDELAQCPGTPDKPCIQDIVQAFSRAAARGASEGVGQKIQPIPIAIAFAVGLAVALLGLKLYREIKNRRTPPEQPANS